jgi:hypothetical protein
LLGAELRVGHKPTRTSGCGWAMSCDGTSILMLIISLSWKVETLMETIEMKTYYKIHAPPALQKFLDARAAGASEDVLRALSDEALAEQEAERATQAKSSVPHLRLVTKDK